MVSAKKLPSIRPAFSISLKQESLILPAFSEVFYIQNIDDILNGVETRSTGYQDDRRYWNLNMNFEENYEKEIIARILEDGERYILVADTVDVADHISFRSLKDDSDNILEEEFSIDMREDYEDQKLYREICRAFESTYNGIENDSDPSAVALD